VADPGLLDRYAQLLSAEEQDRRRRLRTAALGHDYLVAHAFTRLVLSRYAPITPSLWEFRANTHGRPEIAAPRGYPALRFNLSHTFELIACGVALNRAIGVDTEDTRRVVNTTEIAERFFSPAEVAALRALPSPARARRFFEYWTLKESYTKARGLGLSLPLEQLSFHVDPSGTVSVSFERGLRDDARSWEFTLFHPTPWHVLAVAIERRGCQDAVIRLRTQPPE
jgi:4'-phosphopantetheinyl transferase